MDAVLNPSPSPQATAPNPIGMRPRLPAWLKVQLPSSSAFTRTRLLLSDLRLHTVCIQPMLTQ